MHGIDLKTQMDIVYHALNDISKGIIDSSCCGAFKRKSAEEARDLIEDLAKCNMKTPSEFSRGNSRGKGIMELSKMTAMEAKLDTIMHRMDKKERKTYTAHEIGAVERELLKGSAERATEEQFYDAEEVKYLGEPRNYHFKPNTNLPTHYHPTLRNHENLSYGGGASQGPRQGQNPPQGYQQPPRFQQQQQGNEHRNEYQGQRRAQSFEEQMLQFMGDNKKLLNLHEQKFAELGAIATNFQVFQNTTNATLKNMETQVRQLALNLQSQRKDAFPSDTKKNLKDCMAVQLRSGKELEKMKEKNDSSKEEESLEKKEALEKKERRSGQERYPRLQTCSPISTETAEIKDRGAVCKVFENLSEAGDQYALYRSGDSDATICKIPERHAEQEKKDSRRRDCESYCYLQCRDKERIARKDEGSREFYNSLHHWRS